MPGAGAAAEETTLGQTGAGGDMREREPVTQTMKASDVRAQWGQLLNKVARRETRVVVEKSEAY